MPGYCQVRVRPIALDRCSLETKRPVTVPLLRQLLADART
jgi:hypothetical protein